MNVRKLLGISILCSLIGPNVSASDQDLGENGIKTGFEVVNQKYSGNGQTIVVIDEGLSFAPNHPALHGKAIKLIEVGRQPNPSSEFQNQSNFRYNKGFEPNLDFLSDGYHGQQIVSVLLAHPVAGKNVTSGIVPEAQVELISYSDINFQFWAPFIRIDWTNSPLHFASSAIYTYRQASEFIPKSRSEKLKQTLATYQDKQIDLWDKKIDDSIYDAFRHAFQSDARTISVSYPLIAACDFKKAYNMAPEFLEFLANGLKKHDKILVLAAGNQEQDLHKCISSGTTQWNNTPKFDSDHWNDKPWHNYATHYSQFVGKLRYAYFKQFSQHPIIKQRALIAVNVEPAVRSKSEQGFSWGGSKEHPKQTITFSNGQSHDLQLYYSSNYPGADKDLQELTVAALGGHTVADKEDEFIWECGTSFSAPRVAGLVALMDEYYKSLGQKLTGPELVGRLKKNCICPEGFETMFGNGVIDPAAMFNNSTH